VAIEARTAYLDGELCALRPGGTTSFPEMQAVTDEGRTAQLVYFVFDPLFCRRQGPDATRALLRVERRAP